MDIRTTSNNTTPILTPLPRPSMHGNTLLKALRRPQEHLNQATLLEATHPLHILLGLQVSHPIVPRALSLRKDHRLLSTPRLPNRRSLAQTLSFRCLQHELRPIPSSKR